MKLEVVVLSVLLTACLAACGEEPKMTKKAPPAKDLTDLTKAPKKRLTDQQAKFMIDTRCTRCHSPTPVKKAKLTREEWSARLKETECREATLRVSEARALIDYLVRTYTER